MDRIGSIDIRGRRRQEDVLETEQRKKEWLQKVDKCYRRD